MASEKPAIVNEAFAPRLALFYAAYFFATGLHLPFFPVWLAAKGLDPAAIGLVLGAPQFIRVIAVPLATRLADRHAVLRGALVVGAVATAAAMGALALSNGFAAIFAAVIVIACLSGPVMPLGEAYALKGLRGRSYGPVRVWGSVAFIAANLGGGLMLSTLLPQHLIWPIFAGYCALGLSTLLLAPLSDETVGAGSRPRHAHWRDPAYVAVVAASSLTQASHAGYYGFSTLAWSTQGLTGTSIGALWATGVLAEIVLFALSGRLPPALSATALMALGAAGGVVRWICMSLDPPAIALPALQLLHALSFGATHLGLMQFLAKAAPEGGRAAAQGDLATAQGIAMALATMTAGALYGTGANLAYVAMAVLAGVGFCCALVAGRLRR
jgi:MFS transporter, PPP family, 3-phenylpropionic acid transporter